MTAALFSVIGLLIVAVFVAQMRLARYERARQKDVYPEEGRAASLSSDAR